MHRALLGLAAGAAIVSTAPASSQGLAAAGFSASSGSPAAPGLSGRPAFRVDVHRRHGDGHHRHHRGDGFGFGFGWTGYNDFGDYDANRSFDPDRWNDWWHERPERAFPRWMSRNQDCARRWYSADTLTC
jgi:hypothetical protein